MNVYPKKVEPSNPLCFAIDYISFAELRANSQIDEGPHPSHLAFSILQFSAIINSNRFSIYYVFLFQDHCFGSLIDINNYHIRSLVFYHDLEAEQKYLDYYFDQASWPQTTTTSYIVSFVNSFS